MNGRDVAILLAEWDCSRDRSVPEHLQAIETAIFLEDTFGIAVARRGDRPRAPDGARHARSRRPRTGPLMCGVCGIVDFDELPDLDLRAGDDRAGSTTAGRTATATSATTRPCARALAARHHRHRRRRPAPVQRGRHGLDHLQRRDLQLRRAPRRAAASAATASARPATPRSSSTPGRSGARTASTGSTVSGRSALWDRREQRLVLSRDRLGVRPLYFTAHGRAACSSPRR